MPYTDWINLVEKTIPNKKNLNIIEFGLGEGTKYLLDNFKTLYSYELMNKPDWYNQTVNKFSVYENWEHKLVLWNDIGFKDYDTNLPKELLLEGRYLAENFDEQKYFHILDEIFNHTKNNLTTKNLAQYIYHLMIFLLSCWTPFSLFLIIHKTLFTFYFS